MSKCYDCKEFSENKCVICDRLLCDYHCGEHQEIFGASHEVLEYLNVHDLNDELKGRIMNLDKLKTVIESQTQFFYAEIFNFYKAAVKDIDAYEEKYKTLLMKKSFDPFDTQLSKKILKTDLNIDWEKTEDPWRFYSSIKIQETQKSVYSVYSVQGEKSSLENFSLKISHKEEILHLGFSPNSRFLAISSADRTLKLWNIQSLKAKFTVKSTSLINSFAFTKNSTQILAVNSEGFIEIFNVKTSIKEFSRQGHTSSIKSVVFNKSNSEFITACRDNSLKLWDFATKSEKSIFLGHSDSVYCVRITENSHYAISGSFDQTLIVWSLQTHSCKGKLTGHQGSVHTVEMTSNPNIIFSGSADGKIICWDIFTMKSVFSLDGHRNVVYSIVISKDHKYLFSGSADRSVRVWDLDKKIEHFKVKGLKSGVLCSAVCENRGIVVVGMKNGRIRILNIEDGMELCVVSGGLRLGSDEMLKE